MGTSALEEDLEAELRHAPDVWRELVREPIAALEPSRPVSVEPSTTIREAVDLMNRHRIGSVLVLEGRRLAGIFTERDVLSRVIGKLQLDTPVRAVMTRDPETVRLDTTIVYALNKMHVGGYRRIPVVDAEGRAIGVISVRDVVAYLVSLCPRCVLNLPPEPELGIAHHPDGGA